MSLSENKSVVFAYESSVHSTNVLLSLDDQRKQDILCDVTILVEDQRFRAHKAVLAACSSYFLSRIVGQVDADLIITLPEEVSVTPFCILPASASNLLCSILFYGRLAFNWRFRVGDLRAERHQPTIWATKDIFWIQALHIRYIVKTNCYHLGLLVFCQCFYSLTFIPNKM